MATLALVLECVPTHLAAEVTKSVDVPTIGIGAGPHCDGQVLVYHDLLGFEDRGQRELRGVPGEWRLYAVN